MLAAGAIIAGPAGPASRGERQPERLSYPGRFADDALWTGGEFRVGEIGTVRDRAGIEIVARLAREIWQEYYLPIIGQAQIDYMVSKFQSAPAIAAQLADGMEYFLIALDGEPEGYFAIDRQKAERGLFLSKLYIRKEARGRGLGREVLAFLADLCRADSLGLIWVTVNKRNPAVATYEKLGFRIVADVVADIGNGFVMDDYRMEKALER